MDKIKKIPSSLLQSLSQVTDDGLLYGKMGLSIFLFQLAELTGEDKYKKKASELFDSVSQNLESGMSISYASGLAGIGVGIEYLLMRGFLFGDSNEVLEEIDEAIFTGLEYNDNIDSSLEYGLCGIGYYFLYRIKNRPVEEDNHITLRNKQSLIFILDILSNRKQLSPKDSDNILSFLLLAMEINIYNSKIEKLIKYYIQQEGICMNTFSKRMPERLQQVPLELSKCLLSKYAELKTWIHLIF